MTSRGMGAPVARPQDILQKLKISDGLHENSALVNAPERGLKPALPTPGETVLEPTGTVRGPSVEGSPVV